METEIVDSKRCAQQARKLNQTFDNRVRHEMITKKINRKYLEQTYRDNIEKKKKLKQKLETEDRNVPDIAGNEGYPPIYQKTKQQVRKKEVEDN